MIEKHIKFRDTNESINESIEHAKRSKQPVLLKPQTYQDDRGWSFMNMLQGLKNFGQANFSHIHPGTIKAWHKHEKQTDLWVVIQGDLKVGIVHESKSTSQLDHRAWATVIGEHNPSILIIPPELWHGCTVTSSSPAGLLYITDKAYNVSRPDERRYPYDHFGSFFKWEIEHR